MDAYRQRKEVKKTYRNNSTAMKRSAGREAFRYRRAQTGHHILNGKKFKWGDPPEIMEWRENKKGGYWSVPDGIAIQGKTTTADASPFRYLNTTALTSQTA